MTKGDYHFTRLERTGNRKWNIEICGSTMLYASIIGPNGVCNAVLADDTILRMLYIAHIN